MIGFTTCFSWYGEKRCSKHYGFFGSFPRMFSILRTPGTQSWCRYPIIIPDTLRNDLTWQLWNEWISLDLQAMRRFMAFPPSAALGATVTRPPFGPATAGEGPGAPQQPQVLLGQKPTPPEQPQFRCSWGLCCGCSVSLVFSNVFHGSLAYTLSERPTPVQTAKGQIFEMLRRCQIHPMVAWLQTKRAGTVPRLWSESPKIQWPWFIIIIFSMNLAIEGHPSFWTHARVRGLNFPTNWRDGGNISSENIAGTSEGRPPHSLSFIGVADTDN